MNPFKKCALFSTLRFNYGLFEYGVGSDPDLDLEDIIHILGEVNDFDVLKLLENEPDWETDPDIIKWNKTKEIKEIINSELSELSKFDDPDLESLKKYWNVEKETEKEEEEEEEMYMVDKWDIFNFLNFNYDFYYEVDCNIHFFPDGAYESSDDLYNTINDLLDKIKQDYMLEYADYGDILVNLIYLVQDFKFDDPELLEQADKKPTKEKFLTILNKSLNEFENSKEYYNETYHKNVIRFITNYINNL